MKAKFNANEQINMYSHLYNRLCYDLLKEPLFQSFGLELSAAVIVFETDDNFALKGATFGYFNPIDSTIHINIQDPFFTVCQNDLERKTKLVFILFHEMYHKVLLHGTRADKREHTLWNIAADFEVHNMMYLYKEVCTNDNASNFINEFKNIETMLHKCEDKNYEGNPELGEYCFMFDKHYLNKVAEEIYNDLMKSKKISQKSFSLSMDQMMGKDNNKQNQSSNVNQSDNESESDDTDSNSNDNSKNQSGKKSNNKNSKNQSGNDNKQDQSNGDKNQSDNNKKQNQTEGDNSDDGQPVKKVQGQNSNNGGGQAGGNNVVVTTTTYELPNGKKITSTNIEWPDMDKISKEYQKSKDQMKQDAENAELRRQVMEQNLKNEVDRSKGNISSCCKDFLKKLFKVKIDWEKILKNSLQTVLTKSDYFSWARPRRTTMTLDLPYLPDVIDDNGAYGKIFICVDQSGSMSDNEFQKIGNIILDAKEHYKKIVVIQHDSDINNVFEFDDINDDTLKNVFTRTSCGGTSHMPVYKYIADDWSNSRYDDENKISAVIVCSDCCSDIQEAQKQLNAEIPMIYLTPEHCKEYCKGIRGQIIEVE